MHCHLRDCILDFGPLQGFWFFTYERFNGILGDLPNNNCSIEYQHTNESLFETVNSSPIHLILTLGKSPYTYQRF